MADPIVATKLYIPKPRPGFVTRPRLSGRLHLHAGSRVTLVSAPAGFGKTTLLAEWLAEAAPDGRSVAWLSLDQSDDDPRSFWSHVVAALRTATDLGATVSAALQSGEPPSNTLVTALLNELEAGTSGVYLVLDDYHVIDRPEIHTGVAFLIEHLPPNAHIVISTRADPPLPLARLRARGELVEIRSADLRFSSDEVAAYLNGMMRLGLTAKSVVDLEERTEGWIAALQLAALSLNGRADSAAFIANFAGSDRYIFDYLVEEVLQRQPADIRSFLLQTCFLERLSGPLCDAVRETTGSASVLQALHRQNLFLVALDDQRQWYRYHHLFADVLRAHLLEGSRNELPVLQRRASGWFEQQGDRSGAIRHALAGQDFERAAGLIVQAMPEWQRTRQENLLRDSLKALPDSFVRASPVLGIGLVGALLSSGQLDDIDGRLRDAEQALEATERSDGAAGPDPTLARLSCQIEMYRAAMAQIGGDMPAMKEHARRAADFASESDDLGQGAAAGLLGLAFWTDGELEAAERSWRQSLKSLEKAGHIGDALGGTIALADIVAAQGRLREAGHVHEQGLRLAAKQDGYVPRGVADLHASLGSLHREWGDLKTARQHLARSEELGERFGLGPQRYRWCVAMAGLIHAEGDVAGALDLLAEAEQVYAADFFPNVRPVQAIAARVRIADGRIGEVHRWQRESRVTVDDELSFLREFEHLTLARLLLAEQQGARGNRAPADVLRFLGRLEEAAEAGGRVGSLIDILMLQALVHAARHDNNAALARLDRALSLAEPEGYVRQFVDAGPPMAELLKAAEKRSIAPAYARELLAAFAPHNHSVRTSGADLLGALSERELDVLRLLRSDLDGPAIALELEVSLNTMRTHTKNIYEKLGVNSRRSAVRRAEELNLLQRRAQGR